MRPAWLVGAICVTASLSPTAPLAAASDYAPPTAEEMAPMRPAYLAVLATIREPPEMADKPMQVRKAVPPEIVKEFEDAMSGLGDKANHNQRVTAIHKLLELAMNKQAEDQLGRATMYGAIAMAACLDGDDSQTVIGYANKGVGGDDDNMLALRARMYLKEGERGKALDDLEKIMADNKGNALLLDDGVAPRKGSDPCSWSIADIDALGNDPRALAAKGLYLSSFIGFGAEDKGAVKESDIRDLYARSATLWSSPIPYFLAATTLEGIGSEQSMAGAGCLRANITGRLKRAPEVVEHCIQFDEGVQQEIRELTMALVIDPKFAPAISERANKFLNLAQAYYADGKPSRKLFELAIADFSAALAAGGQDKHELYCDRGLALASIGKYHDAAAGYVEGMKYATNGIESDPFIYEQLAQLYMKIGRFNEAADILTRAIINSGIGLNAVIVTSGMDAFRALYPQYGLIPDKIVAEDVRRRYDSQFPESWDANFTSNKSRISSTVLPDLYALRGDAYMRAGRRAAALADYNRLKNDAAWGGSEQYLPRHTYFADGSRDYSSPEPWPKPPATF